MMQFQVLLSLWSVTSQREILYKSYDSATLPLNASFKHDPHVYVTMWKICVRRGFSNAVVLMQLCQGDAVNSNAFYGRAFHEPGRGGHSDFAITIWQF